jgi:hypothetical protein
MPSIAEVFVTVLPSEPVDTTSFNKNVLRPALAAVGLPASRLATTAPDGVPAYPPFGAFGFTTYGVRHDAAVGGCAFHAGVKVVGTQRLYPDFGRLRRLHQ